MGFYPTFHGVSYLILKIYFFKAALISGAMYLMELYYIHVKYFTELYWHPSAGLKVHFLLTKNLREQLLGNIFPLLGDTHNRINRAVANRGVGLVSLAIPLFA